MSGCLRRPEPCRVQRRCRVGSSRHTGHTPRSRDAALLDEPVQRVVENLRPRQLVCAPAAIACAGSRTTNRAPPSADSPTSMVPRMHLDELMRDRQTETGTGDLPIRAAVDLPEALENCRAMLRLHTRTGILDTDQQCPVRRLQRVARRRRRARTRRRSTAGS